MTTKRKPMPKPKPCKLCGLAPIIEPSRADWWATARCRGEGHLFSLSGRTTRLAIEQWNEVMS